MDAIFDWLQRRGRRGVADPGSRRGAARQVLIVATDSHVSPQALADIVSEEAVRLAAHGLFRGIVVVPPQPRRRRPAVPAALPNVSPPASRS
jgi:hypothetical protein